MANKFKDELQKPVVKYGLIMMAALVFVQYVFLPWLYWRNDMSSDLIVKSGFAIKRSALEMAIEDIKAKQEALKEDLALLRQSFLKTENGSSKVELPTKVRQICESFDVKVNRVAVTELEEEHVGLSSFMISLEAESSVDKLFKLVEKLENDKSFFIVSRMTIYSRSNQSMKVRMELQKYVER
ncbi:hypothetical protein KIH87_04680 [Paraneptunicella aestuarii]|uniref:hypothetical protein n=1 Tax=Paraneptunicella aestuarii TaxID=2831148 RepID=UPI001E446125|nr:hypothetical protein [Paraneptunicella aestuarii]UAA39656.1 hypothetical protein KIH87_04680 [Paraneptunicella aestuarii]